MKIIAAYLLAVLGGNNAPDAAAINAILESVGGSAEEADISTFLSSVGSQNIWDLVAQGTAKLASAPSGGAAPAAAASSAASSSAAAPAAAEEKKDEKKDESDVEVAGGMNLFGGDEGGDDY